MANNGKINFNFDLCTNIYLFFRPEPLGGNGDEEGDPEEYGFLPNSQGSPQQNGNGHYGHPVTLTGTGSSQNRPILPEMNDRESRRILRVKRELERIQEVSIYFSNLCFSLVELRWKFY